MQKYAICIGLTYQHNESTSDNLSISTNDAIESAKFLRSIGFNTTLITDIRTNNSELKNKISNEINTIAKKCSEIPMEFVFQYSGHGVRKDGKDEYEGLYLDTDNNNELVIFTEQMLINLFQQFTNTRIYCLFDCCHSGTLLNLPYGIGIINDSLLIKNYDTPSQELLKDNLEIYCFSSSQVNQKSYEGTYLSVFTNAYLQVLEKQVLENLTDSITCVDFYSNIIKQYRQNQGYCISNTDEDQLPVFTSNRIIVDEDFTSHSLFTIISGKQAPQCKEKIVNYTKYIDEDPKYIEVKSENSYPIYNKKEALLYFGLGISFILSIFILIRRMRLIRRRRIRKIRRNKKYA